jgi:hypothetical protein
MKARALKSQSRSRPPPPKGRARGRPDSYRPEFAKVAYKLTLLGLTQQELAEFFDLSPRAFERMIARHPDLRRAIKRAGLPADAEVAASLRKRALGYSHPETKAFLDPKSGKIKTVTITKYYPPSEVAAMMWLSNRQRTTRRWSWRSSVELTNSDPSFKMFAKAMHESDRALEGKYRAIATPMSDPRSDSSPVALEALRRK